MILTQTNKQLRVKSQESRVKEDFSTKAEKSLK